MAIAHRVTLFRQWRERARERRLVTQFTDRDLRDIGLTRGDVYRELARPFWRVDGAHDSVRPEAIGAVTCLQPMKAAATAAR